MERTISATMKILLETAVAATMVRERIAISAALRAMAANKAILMRSCWHVSNLRCSATALSSVRGSSPIAFSDKNSFLHLPQMSLVDEHSDPTAMGGSTADLSLPGDSG